LVLAVIDITFSNKTMKKDTYEIRLRSGELVLISAWKFEIFGLGTFIVHRDVEYPNRWTVSEPMTGCVAVRMRDTRKAAIEAAYADFHLKPSHSKEDYYSLVQLTLEKYKDSPTKYWKEMQDADRCNETEAG